MFKVAVIGGSGMLGRALVDELTRQAGWQVVATAFSRPSPQTVALDIRDAVAVERFIEQSAPHAVVIAAAERRPDVCEHDPALARALNVDAVRTIAAAANRRGAWTLSISTDYVFDGSHPPYRHDSTPAPLNAYGRSKLEGERALADATDCGCVLRLPLLYGPIVGWSESAVTSLVPAIAASAAPNGQPATMDAWAIRYPTFTPDVAFVIRQMLERHARGETITGIVQWSGDEPMSKYEIAVRLAEALRLDAHLTPQHTPTDATPRPHNCHLASSRLETLGIGRRTPFDTAIRQVLDAFPWHGDAS
ncbi:dTDP-4-dehydrorhamnose reductase family protein [Paraburkholderia antibiotica]|uniref:dTDP-4-dehydrorhamnose reductase n=1 Tax=Paraburkholderia antibiotica TaxID=2728839 RepID=A0A7Y0FGQ7_9BURK|nr:SDR family oxidoreductase [Paraburkholderia antibiotica]NML35284.1 SDR family oxidoreductase [Paraburkholderia antibiotica]